MKIILLLLSSAVLAILSYGFFRVNVTDFYTYIENSEKPFDEKKFMKDFKKEAKNISIYTKDKEDKKALKKLLKKHDDYMNVTLYDDHELYMDGSFGKILDEPVGFTPLYILKNDFEQYAYSNFFVQSVNFKDGEGIVYVSSMHLLKYVKYYFYVALFVSLLIFFLPTFIFRGAGERRQCRVLPAIPVGRTGCRFLRNRHARRRKNPTRTDGGLSTENASGAECLHACCGRRCGRPGGSCLRYERLCARLLQRLCRVHRRC